MSHLINTDSPTGQAFTAFCSGDLDISAMSADSRDELASVARMWLDIPAIATPADREDASLPAYIESFIAELELPQPQKLGRFDPMASRTTPAITRTAHLTDAASDFEAAADILTAANAPVHVLADLLDEADYLRSGDLSPLGSMGDAGNVQRRYADTSRASRRATVITWIRKLEQGNPTAAQQRALNLIDGVGA